MHRALLAVVCLVVAPVAAFYVGSEAAQTAVDASDAPLSAALGAGTAVAISVMAARGLGRTWAQSARWAAASLAAAGLLWVLVVVFVFVILDFEPV
jgi:peptidoglycan/LPS O-acetylase OafA/YrhL